VVTGSQSPAQAPLAGSSTVETRIHVGNADRCVHTRIGHARCCACADACPHGAWVIDDERLGINPNACDGCGLCVPACPEGAISLGQGPSDAGIRTWNNHPALFRACERTGLESPDSRVACLHATGVGELLHQYRRGVTVWIASAANCDACPRGRIQRLPESVRQTNALLQSRGLQPIALVLLESRPWLEALSQSTAYQGQPGWTRRNFFRSALRATLNTVLDPAALAGDEQTGFTPPTAWLPDTGPDALFLHSPAIDPLRCNGCDACVRLCPHQVITLETTGNEPCYWIDARHCTGCGICRDVCDQDAVRLNTLSPLSQTTLPLVEGHCPACNIHYHLPAGQIRPDRLCPICARTRHGRQLYQVLK
jgi:NAD-dependent dihydropyrimidine dehydrogenase PreA subunit